MNLFVPCLCHIVPAWSRNYCGFRVQTAVTTLISQQTALLVAINSNFDYLMIELAIMWWYIHTQSVSPPINAILLSSKRVEQKVIVVGTRHVHSFKWSFVDGFSSLSSIFLGLLVTTQTLHAQCTHLWVCVYKITWIFNMKDWYDAIDGVHILCMCHKYAHYDDVDDDDLGIQHMRKYRLFWSRRSTVSINPGSK